MTTPRIKRSRKRAMLHGVGSVVRGAAQIVRQSAASKGVALLIMELRKS